jgi:nicotinate-nucleotide--dimethylbenzimidazole phosphoribosyltransferase
MLAAAAHRVPVVIDGFISGAAALCACALQPRLREFLIASHRSVEQGHTIVLHHLGLEPLFDLGMRLGEGTGAALGIMLAEASVRVLREMATFGDAGVSDGTTTT